jgi:hypothetical protein
MYHALARGLVKVALLALLCAAALVDASPPARAAASVTLPDADASVRLTSLRIENHRDHSTRFRWLVRLNTIPGDTPHAMEDLHVVTDCGDCRTIGIVVQVNVVSASASRITSEAHAFSQTRCAYGPCVTMGLAIQYTVSVPDPLHIPASVSRLTWRTVARLHAMFHTRHITVARVLAGFNALAKLFLDSPPIITLSDPADATAVTAPQAAPNLNHALSS